MVRGKLTRTQDASSDFLFGCSETSPFLNYGPNKKPVERAAQVLEEDRRQKPFEGAIRPVQRSFCAFHQIYDHSIHSCSRLT